jgi:hypothetical protein
MMVDYPPVDAVVVLSDGTRVQVWPHESDNPECFTGCALLDNRTFAQQAVRDASCGWLRAAIVGIDERPQVMHD